MLDEPWIRIADGLRERLNLRREDVFICMVEVSKENWSFGNGEAQIDRFITLITW